MLALRRAVEKYLEDSLAEEILSGSLIKNKSIHVLLTKEEDLSCFSESVGDEISVSSADIDKKNDLSSFNSPFNPKILLLQGSLILLKPDCVKIP